MVSNLFFWWRDSENRQFCLVPETISGPLSLKFSWRPEKIYFCLGNLSHVSRNGYFFCWDLTRKEHPTTWCLMLARDISIFHLFCIQFLIFLSTVMYIITDFRSFCLNYARQCLILPAECSPQKYNRFFCLKFCRQNLSKPTGRMLYHLRFSTPNEKTRHSGP